MHEAATAAPSAAPVAADEPVQNADPHAFMKFHTAIIDHFVVVLQDHIEAVKKARTPRFMC